MKSLQYYVPNKKAFNDIWEKIIQQTIIQYSNKYLIRISYNAQDSIWKEYCKYNKRCKEYMLNPNKRIDRHKVCACYMYAVVSANVLSCEVSEPDDCSLFLNENLAFTVGMSLLRSFILTDVNKSELPIEEKERIIKRLQSGIKFPNCNYGNYRNNFIKELYYAKEECNYNILSLANTLYLLEVFNTGVSKIMTL